MAEPLSIDLRTRVVDAVVGGMSRRQAAVQFKVGTSSAIRWVARALTTGDIAPKPQGGDRRSAAIEAEGDFILSLLGAGGDATLAEMCAALAAKGRSFSTSTLSRPLTRSSNKLAGFSDPEPPPRSLAPTARSLKHSRPRPKPLGRRSARSANSPPRAWPQCFRSYSSTRTRPARRSRSTGRARDVGVSQPTCSAN